MNDEQRDLARRLAAHPRWVWRRGALPVYECAPYVWRHERVEEDGWNPQYCDDIAMPNGWPDARREAWPDLTDAATGGVLWEMAGRPRILDVGETGFISVEGPWVPDGGGAIPMFGGDTLAEACARHLLHQWDNP